MKDYVMPNSSLKSLHGPCNKMEIESITSVMVPAMKHDINLFVGLNIHASHGIINAYPLYEDNIIIE